MTITTLVEKTCTPCRGGIPSLTAQEVAVLHKQVPEWTIHDDARRIERTYPFKNFAQAFAFVHKAADLAEAEGASPGHQFRLGLCNGVPPDQEDQGPARERLHHGREAG